MLAEGQHAGIEVCLSTVKCAVADKQARVVRIENGDVDGRGNPFRGSLHSLLIHLTCKPSTRSSMVHGLAMVE
jgi:hypothetical protein